MTPSRPRAAALATAILALWPAPFRAQTPTTQRQPLEAGQERSGLLSAKDSASSHRGQSWAIRGRRGQPLVVDVISTAFDPELMIVGPGMSPLTDDDGGGSCNARIAFTPAEDGIFWAVIESAGSDGGGGGGGAFTLRASRTAGPAAPGSCGDAESSNRFGSSELAEVPASGSLAIDGDMVRGELSGHDHDLGDGQALAYDLKGTRGATATIDLASTDFDAFLAVSGPGLAQALNDDDAGGQCNARVTLTFPETGIYHVVVTSASVGETGGFTLRARTAAPPVVDTDCEGVEPPGHDQSVRVSPDELAQLKVQGTIALGDDVAGELTNDTPTIVDGTHALVWTITGQRGKTIVVDMVSDAFDAYLMISGPGMGDPLTDDDSGGACNARVSVTFPEDGTYRIVANTVDRGAVGRFHLRVSAEPGPVAKGSCDSR